MGQFIQLLVCVSLSVWLSQSFTPRQVPMKKYLFEKVCMDTNYGTVLGNFYKVRDKRACGTKCTEDNNCNSFLYYKKAGWCRINADVFENRTADGCNHVVDYAEITTLQTLRHAKPPSHCGPVPYIPSIIVNKTSGNYSVGSQFPIVCDPCTSYPSPGSQWVTCGTDGRWIIPPINCVYGPDTGLLQDGTPIPANATGCMSTYNNTCPYSSVQSGLRFDGVIGRCYCDAVCCGAEDCCYDTTCYQENDDYDYYYYD